MARNEPVDYNMHHPIHDAVFGTKQDRIAPAYGRKPTAGASTLPRTSAQPEGFSPMLDVGDTDQVDRQPDGTLRR